MATHRIHGVEMSDHRTLLFKALVGISGSLIAGGVGLAIKNNGQNTSSEDASSSDREDDGTASLKFIGGRLTRLSVLSHRLAC